MPGERWILQTNLDPQEINRRLDMLVSGNGVHGLLAKRGTAPRVVGAKVAPDSIPIVRNASGRVSVKMDVYPPRLTGTIRPNEFVLLPTSGTTPRMEGRLAPRADGTEIDLRLASELGLRNYVMIAIVLVSVVCSVFVASFIGRATPGDTGWSLLVPGIVLSSLFAFSYIIWRQMRGTNRQLVELVCDALDANVVSGPPKY